MDVEIDVGNGNKIKLPFDHEMIKERLKDFSTIDYWCMADEVGEQGTPHTHIYFVAHAPIRFSSVKKKFPTAHIESAMGTSLENRNYITKTGKHKESVDKKTSVDGTFEEWGEMPLDERLSKSAKTEYVVELIKAGYSDIEIIEKYPTFMRDIHNLEMVRYKFIETEYREKYRENLKVIYVYGETGTGKTRGIMERHGYSKVYRTTDYLHPFDGYDSIRHDVMVFEEFRSNVRIRDMLIYLDKYPCELPARYNNKIATYETVYIVSNIPLEKQYTDVQKDSPETWRAFLRRIDTVVYYPKHGETVTYHSVEKYMNRNAEFQPLSENEQERLPF